MVLKKSPVFLVEMDGLLEYHRIYYGILHCVRGRLHIQFNVQFRVRIRARFPAKCVQQVI
jgi:hypothetical protein